MLGTDHAGIATQAVVEKELRAEGDLAPRARPRGVRRARLGVAARSTGRRSSSSSSASAPPATTSASGSRSTTATSAPSTGCSSCSTRRATSTATTTWSTGTSARGRRSPSSRSTTARSTDSLYSIDYPLEGSDESITVATVRPETMLADTAVAVNPDDERYSALVGAHAILPLVGRRLADHRRRARRPRVRHRGAEDHPRTRPRRLRDRPPPRARGDRRHRRGRADSPPRRGSGSRA